MRGAVLRGPYDVVLRDDLPEPEVRTPRDAVVRVTRSAICGTDLHAYRGELASFGPDTLLGHEFVGVVVDAGDEVPMRPGQRVVASDVVACGRCQPCARGWHYQCPQATLFGYSTVVGEALDGGQAEYVRVPYADIVLAPCPDDVSDERMVFAGDGLATAYTAAQRAAVTAGGVVAVIGGGAVGLLSGLCARALGAGTVVVADPSAQRRQAAERCGLTGVTPDELPGALQSAAGAPRVRSVIEAVGSDAALGLAVSSAAAHATVAVLGAHHSTAAPFDAQAAFARELTVSFVVGDPITTREEVVGLLRSGRVDPTAVVSHRLPLSDAAEAYHKFDRHEATKVVLIADDDA